MSFPAFSEPPRSSLVFSVHDDYHEREKMFRRLSTNGASLDTPSFGGFYAAVLHDALCRRSRNLTFREARPPHIAERPGAGPLWSIGLQAGRTCGALCGLATDLQVTAYMLMSFPNRTEAGCRLAAKLKGYKGRSGLVVLGLPRGGVPVAFEVARALRVPLDVLVVRKLGMPGQKELAIGAIAAGGIRVLDEALIKAVGIPAEVIERIVAEEKLTLDQRELLYRAGKPRLDFLHRTVILVDDGIARGATMRAAVKAARQGRPDRVVVAVPVASVAACQQLRTEAGEVICLANPEPFHAVGDWYDDFSQVSDEEVRRVLAASAQHKAA